MSEVSRVLQDQKESPKERAVWWTEYVVRHKGALHMEYAGKKLSLLQYVMIDVIATWSLIFITFISMVVFILKLICCRKQKVKRS